MRRVIKGISVDSIGTGISIIVSFLALPLIFNYITIEEYGVWLTVNGVIAMISMIDMGADQYLTKEISDDLKFNSKYVGNIIITSVIFKIIVAAIIAIIGAIIYMNIDIILKIDQKYYEIIKIAYVITITVLILNIIASTVPTILYSRHQYSFVNMMSAINSIATSLLTIVFLYLGYNLLSFCLALLVATVTQYVVEIIYIKCKYPQLKLSIKGFEFYNVRDMFKYASAYQVLKWVHTIRSQYIIIVLNNTVGPSAAAMYNITNRLPQLISLFSSKIAAPFFPIFSAQLAVGEINETAIKLKKITKILLRYTIFATIMTCLLAEDFINIWVGESKFAGIEILTLLLITSFTISTLGAFGIVIFSTGKFEHWIKWSFVEVICVVSFTYLFYQKFDFIGVIFGFTLATLITPIYLLRITTKQLGIKAIPFLSTTTVYGIKSNYSTLTFAAIVYSYTDTSSWYSVIACLIISLVLNVLAYEGILCMKSDKTGLFNKLKEAFEI